MSETPTNLDSPNTIVRASAGSGKTYKLTNAFMIRLLAGEEPGSMLATTFTRVAAGEILHRVLDRLSGAVIDDVKLAELSDALEDPNLTHDRCAEVLSALVSQLHRLSIMTIDSFFSRLAGSFCFELGLPMNYRLLEEDEDEELRARCVDETIGGCSRTEMVELLRSMQGDKVQMQTHSAIMKAIMGGYSMYLATDGDSEAWSALPISGKKLSDSEIEKNLEQLIQTPMPMTKAKMPNKNWTKAHTKCLREVQDKDWIAFLKDGLGKPMLAGMTATEVPIFSKIEFSEHLISIMLPLVEHARYELSTEHNRRTQAVWELMHRFDSVYREAKMSGGQLNFDDPPRLLNEARVTGDLEHLYYRLDTTLRHVMLDEFQDTSMPQFRLLEPILDELLSQNEEERSVFVVGDVKQSLYTWRQAEPTLLGAMEERWEMLRSETLAESYRSSPIVLDAVNGIFGDLTQNAAMNSNKPTGRDAGQAWHEQYDWHKSARKDMPGYVSLSVADADESREPDEKPDDTSEVLWSCAMRVAEARAQSSDSTIAILVRQGKHIYPLLSMLKKLEIDACEDRGNPLVDAPSVAAAVSMLELIEHPGNSAALFHVRSTPLAGSVGIGQSGGIGRTASVLRDRISREGCVPMLTEWFKACAASMDERGAIRFEQLIELAASLESSGRPGAGTLAMVAQNRRIDEPGHAPVRVMTIHSSKGLEFDVVVLPLLGQAWKVGTENLVSHRDTPLGPITRVTRYPSKIMQQVNPALGELHHSALLRQINEELCCLYVATTRAKRSLQMIVPSGTDGRKGNPIKTLGIKSAHVVLESLAPSEVCEPGAVLYERQTEGHWADGLESNDASPDQKSQPVVLRVRASKHVRASQLTPISPSSMHDESNGNGILACSLLGDEAFGLASREHGLCVHTAFEQFDWIDQSGFSEAQIREKMDGKGLADDRIEAAMVEVIASTESEPIGRLLSREWWLGEHPACTTVDVHHERPIAVRIGDGDSERLIQGRIDRLVIGRDDSGIKSIQIVDYKTDRGAKGLDASGLAEFAKKHSVQMDAYRQAVAAMYGIEESSIEIVLVFAAAGGVVFV